jgi:hypothetical protein
LLISENNRIYDGITSAIDNFVSLLGDTTKIPTKTFREPPKNDRGEIFRWDYSVPEFVDVYGKVAGMFFTEIETKDGKIKQVNEMLYAKKAGKPNTDLPPYFYYKAEENGNRAIGVISESSSIEEDNITRIEEMLSFEGVVQAYRFDEKLKIVLEEIYKSSEENKDDTILGILLENIGDIVTKIANTKLEDMLVMLHPDGSMIKQDKPISTARKDEIQIEALDKYIDYIFPSIPKTSGAINTPVGEKQYSVACIPQGMSDGFKLKLQNQMADAEGYSIPGLMLNSKIYFNFSLSDYFYYDPLKEAYQNKINGKAADVPGLCLAEGSETDWRDLKVTDE